MPALQPPFRPGRPPRLTLRHATLLAGLSVGLAHPAAMPADAIDAAVEKGVAFILNEQDARGAIRENGAHETAMTSLSVLAFAAVGHQPSDPTPAGEGMRKAVNFLLSAGRQDQDGYFGSRDSSRMYGHGITALALSALLGMGVDSAQDAALRAACEKAIALILRSQAVAKKPEHAGGWRYSPTSTDSDLSITVWQLMALRSAKNAGLEVPKSAIDAAVGYVQRAHIPHGGDWRTPAGFRYEARGGPVWSTAAEGLLALQVCGAYEAPEVANSAEWLLHNPPDALKAKSLWFYYGSYYYAQGMYQRGGAHAADAAKRISSVMLPLQTENGSWRPVSDMERNRIYCTALALLSLSVKYHYLPIYQR